MPNLSKELMQQLKDARARKMARQTIEQFKAKMQIRHCKRVQNQINAELSRLIKIIRRGTDL